MIGLKPGYWAAGAAVRIGLLEWHRTRQLRCAPIVIHDDCITGLEWDTGVIVVNPWQGCCRQFDCSSHHDPCPDIGVILLRNLGAPSDQPQIITRYLSRESILCEVAAGQGISLQCESAVGLVGLGVVFRPIHNGNGATRLGYIACWKPDNSNPILKPLLDALNPRS